MGQTMNNYSCNRGLISIIYKEFLKNWVSRRQKSNEQMSYETK